MHSENNELSKAGHELAKCLDSNTPLTEIAKLITRLATALDVTTLAVREATKQRDALAAENAALKSKGRELLNEACGVYEKYNATINPENGDFMDGQTLHEFQFLMDVETPATDTFLREVRAQARSEGINYAASRLAAAFNHGFVNKPMAEVGDVVRMILTTKDDLANDPLPAPDALSGEYAEQALKEWATELRQGGAA